MRFIVKKQEETKGHWIAPDKYSDDNQWKDQTSEIPIREVNTRYKTLKAISCCTLSKRAIQKEFIYVSQETGEAQASFIEEDNISQRYSVKFCPFCGKRVEIDVR